jgi:hypothetical protein
LPLLSRHLFIRLGRTWLGAYLFIISIALVYFFPMLASRNIFVERDLAGFFIPPRYLWVTLVRSLETPLWNPYNYSGIPLLATLQPGVFYPPHVLYLLLPFNTAWNWLIILHFPFAAIAVYHLLRYLKVSGEGAFLGGAMFMLSGYLLSVHNLLPHLLAVAWFPLVILCFLRYCATARQRYMALTAILLTVEFLAGAPEIVVLNIVVLVVMAASAGSFTNDALPVVRASFRVRGLLVTLVLFCLLSSFQLVPFLELKSLSIRQHGLPFGEAITWSFAWRDFIQFFLPDAYGSLSNTQGYWKNQSWLLTLYWGIAPFLLSGFYFLSKDRRRPVFLVLVLISLLLALGGNTPLYKILHRVPPFNGMRYPVKFIYLFFFVFSLTAGIGFDCLVNGVAKRVARVNRAIRLVFYGGFVFALLWGGLNLWQGDVYRHMEAAGFKPPSYSAIKINIHNAERFLLFSFLLSVAVLVYLRTRAKRVVSYAIVLLVIGDLFLANFGYYTTDSWSSYRERQGSGGQPFADILSGQTDTARFMITQKTLKEFNYYPYDRAILGPPYAALFGAYTLGGAEVLRVGYHDRFLNLLNSTPGLEQGKRFLAVGGVRYVITSYQVQDREFRILATLETGGKKAYLYRYTGYPGRFLLFGKALFVNDDEAMASAMSDKGIDLSQTLLVLSPSKGFLDTGFGKGSARLVSYKPNRVALEYNADKDALLFMSDTYYPGWKAFVDGKETTIYRSNMAFRAIQVPKGHHRVLFRYMPFSFLLGLALSGIGMVLTVYILRQGTAEPRSVHNIKGEESTADAGR